MLQNSSVCTPSPVIATVVPACGAAPSTEESVDATPDKPSCAVRPTVTSVFCQSAGASEVVVGATRSILMPSTVAEEWFPAWSSMLAVADRLSPSPVITESAGHGPSSPESASLHVQWTVTSPLYQPFAFGAVVAAPVIVGAVSSTLMSATVEESLLSAASTAWPVTDCEAP